MNTNHTPGPWRLGKPFNGYIWGLDPSRGDASGANWPIAEVQTYRQGRVLSEEDEANARLIAAAPELLAALEKCSALLDAVIVAGKCATFADLTESPMGNIIDPASEARAAIAKATQPQS